MADSVIPKPPDPIVEELMKLNASMMTIVILLKDLIQRLPTAPPS